MNYLYYPGCSLEFSSKPYDESTRAVAKTLGIGLRELDDWNCCGSTAYMSVEELLSFAIASRNLAIAEKQGEKEIVAVCPACYTTLNKINEYLGDKADLKKKINEALGAAKMKYEGTVKTRHFLDIIVNDVGLP
jgi:heterodisulfide reductase subunit B